jgi:hypothetical protein
MGSRAVVTVGVVGVIAVAAGALIWKQTVPHSVHQVIPVQAPVQLPVGQSQPQVAMPKAEQIVLLVRNTFITLNNALQTGNFTVLRDAAAPGFRNANSAASLARAFTDLASRNIDLSVVSVMTPKLVEAPNLDRKKGMLRLKGYFPGEPVRIDFELLYQAVDGRWRLFGLSVQPNRTARASTVGREEDPTIP